MIDEAEVERLRREAERCRHQRGAQGVWARHWLALYEWAVAAIIETEDRKNMALNGVARHG